MNPAKILRCLGKGRVAIAAPAPLACCSTWVWKGKLLMRISTLITLTAILVVGIGGHPASATPITVGALSSNDDGSTEIILDTLNDLEWLRWNVLSSLTYAQTLTAIGTGGSHEGWQIAHNAEAQLFINALYDGGPAPTCDTADGLGGGI